MNIQKHHKKKRFTSTREDCAPVGLSVLADDGAQLAVPQPRLHRRDPLHEALRTQRKPISAQTASNSIADTSSDIFFWHIHRQMQVQMCRLLTWLRKAGGSRQSMLIRQKCI